MRGIWGQENGEEKIVSELALDRWLEPQETVIFFCSVGHMDSRHHTCESTECVKAHQDRKGELSSSANLGNIVEVFIVTFVVARHQWAGYAVNNFSAN